MRGSREAVAESEEESRSGDTLLASLSTAVNRSAVTSVRSCPPKFPSYGDPTNPPPPMLLTPLSTSAPALNMEEVFGRLNEGLRVVESFFGDVGDAELVESMNVEVVGDIGLRVKGDDVEGIGTA